MISTSICHVLGDQSVIPSISLNTISGDKSISHRAIILGSLSSSTVTFEGFLTSEDCLNTLSVFQQLGVKIERENTTVTVHGVGLRGLVGASNRLDVGNSGTGIRLITGVLAGQSFDSVISGDQSIEKRPMKRIIDPLTDMGAVVLGQSIEGKSDIYPPLTVKGSQLSGIEYEMPVASAQVKSAVLLAGLFADGNTTVVEPETCRDHTERLFDLFDIPLKKKENKFTLTPVESFQLAGSGPVIIPSDISSAMFYIVLGLMGNQTAFELKRVGLNPTRIGALSVLRRMGADIVVGDEGIDYYEPYGTITVNGSQLKGVLVLKEEIPNVIDEIPILSVAALVADGDFVVRDAKELRVKESDRIDGVVSLVRAIGGDIEELEDGFVIHGPLKAPRSFEFDSKGDHRLAMSAIIAAVSFGVEAEVSGCDSIQTSFPNFFDILTSDLGITVNSPN